MRKCIYCNSIIKVHFLNFFTKNNYCLNCFSKFTLSNKKITKNFNISNNSREITYYLLFEYNEYAKDYMYFYKKKCDISLCLLFTDFLNFSFNHFFNLDKSIITYIPSSQETFNSRGFNPCYELLKSANLNAIHSGLSRVDNEKQGKLSFKKRKKAKHLYNSARLETNKNLIIFDDVISTGTTIYNFLENIENLQAFENIFVISLFHSRNFK